MTMATEIKGRMATATPPGKPSVVPVGGSGGKPVPQPGGCC